MGSVLNGISVYKFQLELGRRLADQVTEMGWDVDIVVPVPDGARPVAIELSSHLSKPYREGLVKNRWGEPSSCQSSTSGSSVFEESSTPCPLSSRTKRFCWWTTPSSGEPP